MTETALNTVGLDPETLLAPIAGDNPAGEWLRYDAVYQDIRKLREEDDADLPQGVWQKERKRADWSAVADRATAALTTRSKDLQLAAWLTEAWLNLYGFAGLESGLRVTAALCHGFWEHIYPPPDGENYEPRMAPLAWAAEKLVLPVQRVPITAPAGEDQTPYRWLDSEMARYQENLAKSKGVPPESGVVTHPKFLVSVSMTPAQWYADLASQLAGAVASVADLEETVVTLAGEEKAPSFNVLRATLASIQSFVSRVLAERVQSGELAPWALGEKSAAPFEGPDLDAPRRGAPITSRAEAFERLREAAEYLMRTEPHSPVPYLVRRAVSWEHMSLAELLEELLAKSSDLGAIYALLGIKR
jgi:type VI secretion system ImpA family protein